MCQGDIAYTARFRALIFSVTGVGLGHSKKIRWKKLFGALYFESPYKSNMETPLLFRTGLFMFHRRTFSSLLNLHLPHDYVNLFLQ